MNLFRILLCDSNVQRLKDVESTIQEFFCNTTLNYTLFKFSNASDIKDYLLSSQNAAEIIFISSLLEQEDGIDLSAELKEQNKNVVLVLYGDVEGRVEDLFYANVSYYLYSPVCLERMTRCLQTITLEEQKQTGKYLNLKNKKGFVYLEVDDISYIVSDKRKISIVTSNANYEFYMKLDEISEMLGNCFLRTHQSYLANMKKIFQFTTTELILNDGNKVPISEKRYYSAKKEYLNYIKTQI